MGKKNYNNKPTQTVQYILHNIPRREYERFVFTLIDDLEASNPSISKKLCSLYADQLESEHRTHGSKRFSTRGENRIRQNAARRTIRRGLYTMSAIEFENIEAHIQALCTKISAVIKIGG